MTIRGTLRLDEAARRTWGAVVVGAGPAGALAAHQLARGGRCRDGPAWPGAVRPR
jgi:NADPH-dependent 2,4-dienoyl-CoA reductase/sulfur reductase-like enzyme